MKRRELIKKYIEFFKKKGHKEIENSSLITENDPSVLFTTAGMHPLIPYLLGEKHPLGKRLVNVQRCVRTTDIEEVGDGFHHTFFEMLGNWSLGDYFKEESIRWSFEFLTKVLKLEEDKIAVTCFLGDSDSPKDTTSWKVWLSLGIKKERILFLPKEGNWWGPAGESGPCGPDTEIFYWNDKSSPPKEFSLEDKNWIEIWNNVFMEYNKTKEGKYVPLKQKNVDTGMGVERTLSTLNSIKDNYLGETFILIIKKIEQISKERYLSSNEKIKRAMRIIADHAKAAVFILGDDKRIKPSNKEHGYVVRRIIRRAIRYGREIGIKEPFLHLLIDPVIEIYPEYEELKRNKSFIIEQIKEEEQKFRKTIYNGLKKLDDIIKEGRISGKNAFLLYQSYGFPLELTTEIAKEKNIEVDIEEFNTELKRHQEMSKTASKGRFRSGLADESDKTTRLHTATHLLNEALRRVLDPSIRQRGSNITPERLRFDFNFNRKLTEEEIRKVEALVNKKIEECLEVKRKEMLLREAIKEGAQSEFGAKYPEIVSVYTIGDFSKEICTGPHVKNTREIGKFKIIKEEGVAAGIRRIKAVVYDNPKDY
ncbi:MAG: alanine--tRNA ligase [Candidatus Pacearchaeota archaeon]